jgi:DNA-binding NarL/FixJ family response regulator
MSRFGELGQGTGVSLAAEVRHPPPPSRTRVVLDVRDPILRRALEHLLASTPTDDLRIGDEVAEGLLDVLVVKPNPLACREGLSRAVAGEVGIVLSTDTLDELPSMLGEETDSVRISRRVLALANQLPALSERDLAILRGLLLDASTMQLARQLRVSEATVKRAVTALMSTLGVSSKAGLVAKAVLLGLRPGGTR